MSRRQYMSARNLSAYIFSDKALHLPRWICSLISENTGETTNKEMLFFQGHSPQHIFLFLVAELSQWISQNCDWTATSFGSQTERIKKNEHVWFVVNERAVVESCLITWQMRRNSVCVCTVCAGTSQTVDKDRQVIGFFLKDALNPLLSSPQQVAHLHTSASEFRGLAPRALTLDLFIIFGLLSSTHSCSFSPHRASHTSHKLITSTIISSSRER